MVPVFSRLLESRRSAKEQIVPGFPSPEERIKWVVQAESKRDGIAVVKKNDYYQEKRSLI